jgi:hypothetical protein
VERTWAFGKDDVEYKGEVGDVGEEEGVWWVLLSWEEELMPDKNNSDWRGGDSCVAKVTSVLRGDKNVTELDFSKLLLQKRKRR